eukprot:699108-Prymnesium_polylepis.1
MTRACSFDLAKGRSSLVAIWPKSARKPKLITITTAEVSMAAMITASVPSSGKTFPISQPASELSSTWFELESSSLKA